MLQKGLATLLLLLLLTRAGAQDDALARVAILGEAERTTRRLAAVDALLAAKQYPEAVKELEQILREAGDDLVPDWTSEGGNLQLDRRHCRQARWLCHQRLAGLPAEALQLYRQRVDAQARQWLEQGQKNRDPAPLRRLVEDAFCSRHGEPTLDLLGDLAFECGAFEEARRWWEHLVPSSSSTSPLVFPDPTGDRAAVRAKQLLARIAQGEDFAAAGAWETVRKELAGKEGHLAGRRGNFVDILEVERDRQKNWSSSAQEPWPTFAGDVRRGGLAPLRPLRWQPQPRWRVPLPDAAPAGTVIRSGPFHPVVLGKHAFWADARRVTALDLGSGVSFSWELSGATPSGAVSRPAEAGAAFTLTASGGMIYARLGAETLGATRPGLKAEAGESFLVCLEPQPGQQRFRERWLVRASTSAAIFEGAPAVRHGRVHAALTRIQGERAYTALSCYDAETGRLLWLQDVCEADEFTGGHRRARHNLVTCAGGLVVYCSHAGAVVAVDAVTGRRAWAVRYPGRGPRKPDGQPSPRALAPCVAAGEKLFVAPADYGRVLCLHTGTGHLLWESNPLETVHLLGVVQDRLYLTARTPYSCLRAFDGASGRDAPGMLFPEEDARLISQGRGVLTHAALLWPTNAGLQVLDLTTLRPRPESLPGRSVPGGNVVLTPEHLLIADREVLSVYER